MVPDPQKKTLIEPAAFRLTELLTKLVAPETTLRLEALADLKSVEEFQQDPLVIYLLATRLSDPDLAVRKQAVELMGELLGAGDQTVTLSDRSLAYLAELLVSFGKDDYLKLLELSSTYLAAEEAVGRILQISSYAGTYLSGIVNDRKLPFSIRQQAIFFCGEIGFLSTATTLRNLVQRIEKKRARIVEESGARLEEDQEALYLQALSALAKLEN